MNMLLKYNILSMIRVKVISFRVSNS